MSLISNATGLVKFLDENPETLTNINPPKERVEYKGKVKAGVKVHAPKPTYHRDIDFEAIDLKTDLMIALRNNDHREIAMAYYTLAHLISY